MRTKAALLLVLSLVGLVGCDAGGWLVYVFSPRKTETVKAQFSGLEKHTVAVVLWMEDGIQMEYPRARLTLGTAIRAQLKENIDDVQVISPEAVGRFQIETLHWEDMTGREIGKALGADYVIFVNLSEYATHDISQISAYQARISADVQLYDATLAEDLDNSPVWQSSTSVQAIYPEHAVYTQAAEGPIRTKAEAMFADQLAKLFYTHTLDVEGE